MDVAVDLEGKLFAGMTNIPIRIPLERMESWTPEHPYLYLYTVVAGKDRVESYFAMRCFTVEKTDGDPASVSEPQTIFPERDPGSRLLAGWPLHGAFR